MKNHPKDLKYLENLTLQTDFASFLHEYVYAVVASGFKGKVAATIVDKFYNVIEEQGYDNPTLADSLFKIFKNQSKIRSICNTIEIFTTPEAYKQFLIKSKIKLPDTQLLTEQDKYKYYITHIKNPEQLAMLPFIGPVTCYHLSRNLGVKSTVKPDLHLCRLVSNLFNIPQDDKKLKQITIEKIEQLAKDVQRKPGCVDFCLWVYLSHQKQQQDCCFNDKIRLR